ncbi:MAG: hypothetical protein LBG06_11830 [Deltaproteobacteria bacterium]|jgi:hypothetical protein|nr:hypothetical protein [Deltaproteobacteria bacterium]
MISSLLSMANNALSYSYKPVSRPGAPPASGAAYQEDREIRGSEARGPRESDGAGLRQDRFSESLAGRLKETGLSGPEAPARIAEVTAKAQEIVSRIRAEEGAAAANSAKARILTAVSAENADAVLAGVAAGAAPRAVSRPLPGEGAAPGQQAAKTAEDLKESAAAPSAEEIARRAADRLADEAADAADSPPPAGTGERGAASAVRSALDEIEAFSPAAAEAEADAGLGFFSLVNKAEAAGAARIPSPGLGFPAEAGAAPRAYQAAYQNRLPGPGSLFSVRV